MAAGDFFPEPFTPPARRQRAAARLLAARGGLDFVTLNLPALNKPLTRLRPWPRGIERVRVPLPDGAALGAVHAPGNEGAPAVLFVPGTFHTKDDTLRRRKILRLWRARGCHVLAVDLRGFGESHAHLGTGGWMEGRDLLEAARFLRERAGVEGVHVIGESLGGASALLAAAEAEAPSLLAGALAWSPFTDLAEQIEYTDADVPPAHPFYPWQQAYRFMLRVRSGGRYLTLGAFLQDRARSLGVPYEELVRRGSPLHCASRIGVPARIVHAHDDPVVPVRQAQRFDDACRDDPRVGVHITPAGSHILFDLMDPAWYWRVTDRFLGLPPRQG